MPVLHLLVGPNGAGKTTLWTDVLAERLPFINADEIARRRWPGDEVEKAYEAARLAAEQRSAAIVARRSFATETVFSHPSKLDLVREAKGAGYRVVLHVVMVPVELAVARTRLRAEQGGHRVPAVKVRRRHRRLWPLVATAIGEVDEAIVYDNARADVPFDVVRRYVLGALVFAGEEPDWSPLPQ